MKTFLWLLALIAAVEGTAAGRSHLDPAVAGRLMEHISHGAPGEADPLPASLTEREREVLGLLGRGWSNAAIASHLRLAALIALRNGLG